MQQLDQKSEAVEGSQDLESEDVASSDTEDKIENIIRNHSRTLLRKKNPPKTAESAGSTHM